MSHFMTLVLTASPAEVNDALAPFEQNNYGTCDPRFLVFQDEEAAHREAWETRKLFLWHTPDGRYLKGSEEDFFEPLTAGEQKTFLASSQTEREKLAPKGWRRTPCPVSGQPIIHRMIIPASYVRVEVALRDIEPDYDAWLAGYAGDPDAVTGRHGRWENPNAMWDGWSYGGRYSCLLLVPEGAEVGIGRFDQLKRGITKHPGTRVDQARLRDILLDDMLEAARQRMAEEWDSLQTADTAPELRDFMLDGTATRFDYMNSVCHPMVPYALVRNGIWHQAAEATEPEAEPGAEKKSEEPEMPAGGHSGGDLAPQGKSEAGFEAGPGEEPRICTVPENKNWPDYVMDLLSGIDADTWVSVVDCHS